MFRFLQQALLVALIAGLWSCQATVKDPMADLNATDISTRRQYTAMEMLDAETDSQTQHEYIETLKRIVWRPGYTVGVREAAVDRLETLDTEGLQRTLRQHVPNLNAWEWLERVCEIIADRGWVELTPALVSSWSRPTMDKDQDFKRPEYLALSKMYGNDRVIDVVFDTFLAADKPSEQGLRTRCWDLLMRLGQKQRLVDLLKNTNVKPDDLMLADLRAGANDFGIVPRNREEILWLRKLRQPEHAEFWSSATEALSHYPSERQAELELRDLPIVVAAYHHQPDMLTATKEELYNNLDNKVRGRKTYSHTGNFNNYATSLPTRLYGWKNELTWSDLAAMLLLVQALDVPELRSHIFNFAQRDHEDETTEYGGIINLDNQGRYELVEFIPRIREHDERFLASQEMMDAGYTALCHIHFHCQSWRNTDRAGPSFGDTNYANNLRANNAVFTCVSDDELNVDYYRYDNMRVDLGTVSKP